jgi:hypothetical protein
MSYPVSTVHRMKPKRLWQRIESGHLQNIDFADFVRLLERFG